MNYVDKITEFLLDQERRVSTKAIVIIFAIILLFFVDNTVGFSYYYNNQKKIEQLKNVNSIISDPLSDSLTKFYAINLRTQIIERKPLLNQFLSFFRNKSSSNVQNTQIKPPQQIDKTKESNIRNNFIFHITSGGLYYFISILVLPLMFFTEKTKPLIERIATGFLVAGLVFSIGLFFYWVCNFIPQLSKSTWTWNYILNTVIQCSFIIIPSIISANQKK